MSKPNKKPTRISIDKELLSEAKALDINLTRATEYGVEAAVNEAKALIWKSENSKAIESSNNYVNKNGLRLDKLRPY